MAAPLPDDLIGDILLRVPPEDPAGLVRASAVCKAWRRIVIDPNFSDRYRAHHRRTMAPFSASSTIRATARHPASCPPRPSACPPLTVTGAMCGTAATAASSSTTTVCAPPRRVSSSGIPSPAISTVSPTCPTSSAMQLLSALLAVTTAIAVGPPFIVAFASVEYFRGYSRDAYGELYSSETGKWNSNGNVHLYDAKFDLEPDRTAAHVGDSLYFVGTSGMLLRFWYGPLLRLGSLGMLYAGISRSVTLTLIEPPAKHLGKAIVMTAEGGGLGLACLNHNRIALWARETKAGSMGDLDVWVKRKTIDLNMLIPHANPKRLACLSGVIPGDANVIFVSTEDGIFKVELEPSLHAKKVSEMGTNVKIIYPFVSFYTETLLKRLASSILPASEGNL